jgi:hypothetical protein
MGASSSFSGSPTANFAFIHGAGDVGWYWHLVEAELRAFGHDTVALEGPGDGHGHRQHALHVAHAGSPRNVMTSAELVQVLEVRVQQETVWLSLNQMAELFQRDKSVISRHISNVFDEGELVREGVVANFATTASDGKTYQVDYYNLDAIISCVSIFK